MHSAPENGRGVGTVRLTHGATYVFDDDEIVECLDRHFNRDFGIISRYDIEQNLLALDHGRPFMSVFELDRARTLLIRTTNAKKARPGPVDLSAAMTICFLLEEL